MHDGVLALLQQAARERLYGSITVKMEDGRVTQVKQERTFLPKQLPTLSDERGGTNGDSSTPKRG